MINFKHSAFFCLACIVATAVPAQAQTSRGTVNGIVTDASGATLPNAMVRLTNNDTNQSRSTTTNDAGLYRFDAVDPGTYEVNVSATGFRAFEARTLPVQAGQLASVDAQLQIGDTSSSVEVTAGVALLQTEAPVRGGSISTKNVVELPIQSRNPNLIALTLPGVSTNRFGLGIATFSVNGSRGRSNNFLLDGTENNDISVAGQAFQVTNPDAVQEISVQTGNYDAEYGRAGGAVVNTITRSGTNAYHGTAGYLIESTRFDAITTIQALDPEVQKRGHPLAGTDQWFSGTFGGKIIRDRTFFFGSYQEERQNSSSQVALVTLSPAGRATLNRLFPAGTNANVDLYNKITGAVNATGQFFPVDLGAGRGSAEFGTALYAYPQTLRDRFMLGRLDHRISDKDQLSVRYGFDSQISPTGGGTNFPGFFTSFGQRYNNSVITETHVFSPAFTNELRLPYNRIEFGFPIDASNPLGQTLPRIAFTGTSLNSLGVSTSFPQGRIANNYGLQDTVSYTRGSHTLRAGLDLLDQRSRQAAPFAPRGQLSYRSSTGFSSFANFVDDFGGSNGLAARDFGSAIYYPILFRQAYFLQDRWRATSALTLTLGVRYENFGVPINTLRTPAYTGLFNVDPVTFTGPFSQPNKVQPDNNNFAPTVGIAYAPAKTDGPLGWIFGQKHGVFRAGYQIGYDSFFNNIASNAAVSSPNILSTQTDSIVSATAPRGLASLSSKFPLVARAPSPLDVQQLAITNLVNPYYQRWSGGIQRELPGGMVLDVSYVGTKGTKLFLNEEANPLVPASLRITPQTATPILAAQLSGRLDNLQGQRTVRGNSGSSTYHSGQLSVQRRFSSGVTFSGAYTYSKLIDYGGEIFSLFPGASGSSLPVIPEVLGGLPRERAVSIFDRTHRAVFSYVYELPIFKTQRGFTGRVLGGWQLSGITTFESGVPYTIFNGINPDAIAGGNDRPDFNPAGLPRTRAVPDSSSPTGFINVDTGNPIDRSQARYIGLPVGSGRTGNLGRNTERTPGINNFDLTVSKSFRISERVSLQLRTEFFDVFNHPQHTVPGVSPFSPGELSSAIVNDVFNGAPGQFMDPSFAESAARVVRYHLKIVF